MLQLVLEILMFFVPGLQAELIYRVLEGDECYHWTELIRVLGFSLTALALRCLVSLARGNGDYEVSVIFHGTGNFVKYFIFSFITVLLAPPCVRIVKRLIVHICANKTAD